MAKAKVLKFTKRGDGDESVDTPATEKELQRAHRFFRRGEPIAESIWRVANEVLAERARTLSFASRSTYVEAMRETMRRSPHLRLGLTAYLADSEFPDVQFADAEANGDGSNA